ncbi:MAG TPA: hypothetical protein DCG75_05225 [Bacteroidales bacterium]|nr:hypothetical protein [Bacteroidales bacterium]
MSYSFFKKSLILAVISLFLSGCYEDYLIISSDFKSGLITSDSSQIFFFHHLRAGQPPKGISRFPDGGVHKRIYENLSLYSFDIPTKSLVKIYDFGDIPFGSKLEYISLQNERIAFSVSPLMGWDWVKKQKTDSVFYNIFDKYGGFYEYNLNTKNTERIFTDGFYPTLSPDYKRILYLKRDSLNLSIWCFLKEDQHEELLINLNIDLPVISTLWRDNNSFYYSFDKKIFLFDLTSQTSLECDTKVCFIPNKLSIQEIKKLTKECTFKDWGFDLSEYFPKTKKEFINDIVVLNGNLNYRKAILEKFGNDLNNEEIGKIIKDMDSYQKKLEGYKQTEYGIYSKETKDLLKEYLD